MNDERGAVLVAYGDAAAREAGRAISSLKATDPRLPVYVISNRFIEGAILIPFGQEAGYGARWAKLNIDLLSPFKHTLYLDADTSCHRSIMAGFDILADGWDIVMAHSHRQWDDTLGHLPADDRSYTLGTLGMRPVNLQAGVMFFTRNKETAGLFKAWREEWVQYRRLDQGALLRALYRQPVKVWLLGRPWNGGGIIEHRFGAAVGK